jgi:hypothetical protein
MLQADISSVSVVSDVRFKYFMWMLHIFAVVAQVYCKRLFPIFYLFFSDVCCNCIYLDVAYVLHICCKCFPMSLLMAAGRTRQGATCHHRPSQGAPTGAADAGGVRAPPLAVSFHGRNRAAPIFPPYVANVCFNCFGCFRGMLEVFHMYVVKLDRDVAYFAMTIHVCCKRLFHFFADVCYKCFYLGVAYILHICCKRFYLDVSYAMAFASFFQVFF